MTNEFYAIITVGLGLAGLLWCFTGGLRGAIGESRERTVNIEGRLDVPRGLRQRD